MVSPGSAKQQIILSTSDFESGSSAAVPSKPTKTGSLCIFFRKVYHVAHLRLDFLCHTLEIAEEVKRKIWTAFEYTIRQQTDLMKDRHLDQLLMCSLYIVCKVRPTYFEDTVVEVILYSKNSLINDMHKIMHFSWHPGCWST